MRPIRIGIAVIEFPTPSETFIVTKVLGLLDAGFDVQIFAYRESPYWDRFDALRGRDDVRQRIHISPREESPARWILKATRMMAASAIRQPRALVDYIAHNIRSRDENQLGFLRGLLLRPHFIGHELDVLHVEFDMQAIGVVDLKDYLGARVLLSSRGSLQRTNVLRNHPGATKFWFGKADGYHFISEHLRANTHALGLKEGSVQEFLVEPAIDLSLFKRSQPNQHRPGSPLRVLSVGRLSWEKGYEFSIDAIARLRDRGIPVEYTIVGEGDYREAIEFAVRQQRVEDIVRLAGAVAREKVVEFYERAHVMLHCALDEGFCNAVIEGQSMELPVIVSNIGGLPENVDNGVTGYVVPARDPEAIAARLAELAADEPRRSRLGVNGRARVIERFDLRSQVDKFASIYRELVRNEEHVRS